MKKMFYAIVFVSSPIFAADEKGYCPITLTPLSELSEFTLPRKSPYKRKITLCCGHQAQFGPLADSFIQGNKTCPICKKSFALRLFPSKCLRNARTSIAEKDEALKKSREENDCLAEQNGKLLKTSKDLEETNNDLLVTLATLTQQVEQLKKQKTEDQEGEVDSSDEDSPAQ